MKNIWKLIIVIILATAIFMVFVLKNKEKQQIEPVAVTSPVSQQVVAETNIPAEPKNLPKLIDLGADKCIPCKMMKPILDELTVEYKGKIDVVFYDVWKNESYARQYGVEIIPTQIFFDPNGKELFRHQGFFAKDEIMAKWKELGFDLR